MRTVAAIQMVRRGVPHAARGPSLDQSYRRARRAHWLRESGRIHGAGDHGPNPAAEIAMQIAGRHAGFLGGAAP